MTKPKGGGQSGKKGGSVIDSMNDSPQGKKNASKKKKGSKGK
jgi:hypothetical protein